LASDQDDVSGSCFYQIGSSGPPKRVGTARAAVKAAEESGFAWLHYNEATRVELEELAGLLGIHYLSIEDCLDNNQIPKIEDFPDNSFILFNTLDRKSVV
jgi:magnesium transporter